MYKRVETRLLSLVVSDPFRLRKRSNEQRKFSVTICFVLCKKGGATLPLADGLVLMLLSISPVGTYYDHTSELQLSRPCEDQFFDEVKFKRVYSTISFA